MVVNSKKKRKTVVPKDETPEQRTRRLASFRVSRAVKDIGSIANLAGASYTLTEPQRVEILAALKSAVGGVTKTFSGEVTTAAGFTLSK